MIGTNINLANRRERSERGHPELQRTGVIIGTVSMAGTSTVIVTVSDVDVGPHPRKVVFPLAGVVPPVGPFIPPPR